MTSSLTSQLEEKIAAIGKSAEAVEAGVIAEIGDGIALIDGMHTATAGEILAFPGNVFGLALNLNSTTVGAIILGDSTKLKQGDLVRTTGKLLSIGAGDALLGRVIDPLGAVLDGGGEIKAEKDMLLERVAPGVIKREPVSVPLQTGIKAIDSMIPVGRGQRELIIGDRSTGKSAVALTTIMNQKEEDVVCIYVSIGQKRSSVAQTNIYFGGAWVRWNILSLWLPLRLTRRQLNIWRLMRVWLLLNTLQIRGVMF